METDQLAVEVLNDYIKELEEAEGRSLKRLDILTEVRVDVNRSLMSVDAAIHNARNDVQRASLTLIAARLELEARTVGSDEKAVKG
jgi:hypothetical protein